MKQVKAAPPIWEGVYASFGEAPASGKGFDGETWISNSLQKIASLRDEAAQGCVVPPPGNYRHCLLPLLAALVYNEQGRARILDFGGSIGFTYYQTLCGLPQRDKLEYHIVERENVCRAGREFFKAENGGPEFFAELPQGESAYDIVYMGSAMQYVEDWKGLLARLCALSRKHLLLVDVPAGTIPTFVSVQHYYGAKIPVWFFDLREILHAADSSGYEPIFASAYQPLVLGAEQDLPMKNFEKKYRLKRACNLLFRRSPVKKRVR